MASATFSPIDLDHWDLYNPDYDFSDDFDCQKDVVHSVQVQDLSSLDSWLPAPLPRATSWHIPDDREEAVYTGLRRPNTFHCEAGTFNKDKEVSNRSYSLVPSFQSLDLQVPASLNPANTFGSLSNTSLLDYCIIREASATLPLRDFLNWLHAKHNIGTLTTGFRRRSPHLTYLPKDHYHDLLAMEAEYDPHGIMAKDAACSDIMHAIYATLRDLRKELEADLVFIDSQHAMLPLRAFVTWTYTKFRDGQQQTSAFKRQSLLWNPHQITSSSRVVKEAVAFFSEASFAQDRGKACIYAKHIAYLLSGGKDWRENVSADDALLVRHAEPVV
jgi:hypothetical protein